MAVTMGFESCEKIPCSSMVNAARRSTSGALSGVSSLNSARSAPAQKATPAPVSAMLRTRSSASAARRPSSSACVSAWLSALRLSGLFMVKMRTAPRSSISSSDMDCLVSTAKPRQTCHRGFELGDEPLDHLRRRQQLVDQSDALADLDLALVDVAVQRRHLQAAAGVQRRQVLRRCSRALGGL